MLTTFVYAFMVQGSRGSSRWFSNTGLHEWSRSSARYHGRMFCSTRWNPKFFSCLGGMIPREVGLHNGKLFEYLGAGRPILALFGSPGVMTEVLEETRAGSHLQSREELRRFLTSSYSEYKRYGQVRYAGDASAIAQYTHAKMARRFADVLDAVSSDPREQVLD